MMNTPDPAEMMRRLKADVRRKSLRLTPVQTRVMNLLDQGYETKPGNGTSILIKDRRMCNVDTLIALERAGLVERVPASRDNGMNNAGYWRAKTNA